MTGHTAHIAMNTLHCSEWGDSPEQAKSELLETLRLTKDGLTKPRKAQITKIENAVQVPSTAF